MLLLRKHLIHRSGSTSHEISRLLPLVKFYTSLVKIKVEESIDLGWCEISKEKLRLIFDSRIEIHFRARNYKNYPMQKAQCIDAKCNVRDATRTVKMCELVASLMSRTQYASTPKLHRKIFAHSMKVILLMVLNPTQ